MFLRHTILLGVVPRRTARLRAMQTSLESLLGRVPGGSQALFEPARRRQGAPRALRQTPSEVRLQTVTPYPQVNKSGRRSRPDPDHRAGGPTPLPGADRQRRAAPLPSRVVAVAPGASSRGRTVPCPAACAGAGASARQARTGPVGTGARRADGRRMGAGPTAPAAPAATNRPTEPRPPHHPERDPLGDAHARLPARPATRARQVGDDLQTLSAMECHRPLATPARPPGRYPYRRVRRSDAVGRVGRRLYPKSRRSRDSWQSKARSKTAPRSAIRRLGWVCFSDRRGARLSPARHDHAYRCRARTPAPALQPT